jgi:hypothetical protein
MEKISNIVRGNARVASTDPKSASAVRPGTPTYGRPVGESPEPSEKYGTTASRAVALHNDQLDHRRTAKQDEVAAQMADSFFMTRIRRPQEQETEMEDMQPVSPRRQAGPPVGVKNPKPIAGGVHGMAAAATAQSAEEAEAGDDRPPVGFTPRGSYVDVRA